MPTTTDVPSTAPTVLYMYGHQKLGYSENRPGTKAFNVQAAILHRVMEKRGIAPAEFTLAVDYCAAEHKLIKVPAGVFRYLDDAKKWDRARKAVAAPAENSLEERIEAAIQKERTLQRAHTLESYGWTARLLRARGPYREELLEEWEHSYEH